jgi:cytochrome P450
MGTTLPPSPRGHWLIGNAWQIIRDPLTYATRWAREYGDVVRLRFGPLDFYALNHPDAVEYVLRGNHRNFIKDKGTRLLSGFLGQGLVTSEGDLWRRQRRLAQPGFQLEQVQKYGAVMVAYARRLLEEWRPGQTRDVHHDMMRLTLEVVAQTLFSATVTGQAERMGRAMDVIMKYWAGAAALVPWLQRLPTPGNLRYRRTLRELDAIILGAVAQRRVEGAPEADDLLGRFLAARDEDGSRMSDRQLRDELVTLFLAGHETTAVALSFCFYLLAQHPEAEARLAAEVDEVLRGEPPTAAAVGRLRYAEWVVKEAMRIYPPVPSIGREALAECEVGGYTIPKGGQIVLSQWVVHRDGRWFDEPLAFRPERWDNDLARSLPRGAYFPFGDGPRICIGNQFALMEAVLILTTVVQRYRLTLPPGPAFNCCRASRCGPKAGSGWSSTSAPGPGPVARGRGPHHRRTRDRGEHADSIPV